MKSTYSSFDSLTLLPDPVGAMIASGKSDLGTRGAMQAFDELVKTIKALELPLSLVSCQPAAEGLRYTSILSPHPIPLARYKSLPECVRYVHVHDAVLQFEKSAKWPDDLGAIQKLKLAWFEKVARDVMEKIVGSFAAIALDANSTPIEDSASLEVALPSGHAFRLRIYHDREKTLLDRMLNDKSTPPLSRVEAERALRLHVLRFIHAPRYHAAIANVHHNFVGYSPTVRLVKRWFSSHLLSLSISPELIELICAHVFVRPDSRVTPSTGPAGFSRTMEFLKIWDWRTEPILLPLFTVSTSEKQALLEMPSNKKQVAEDSFKELRAVDPSMGKSAWFIATEEDTSGSPWSSNGHGPPPMIADRIRILAKASWECIQVGMEAATLDVKVRYLIGGGSLYSCDD